MITTVPGYATPISLAPSGVASSVSSSTTEVNLASIKIPGGMIGPNGWVAIHAQYKYVGVTNTKRIMIRLSTTSGDTSAGLTIVNRTDIAANLTNEQWRGFMNANSASVQVVNDPTSNSMSAANSTVTAGAINTAADTWINFNGFVTSASDSIQLLHYAVTVYYGA